MLQQMTLQNKILCASFGVFLILYYFVNQDHTSGDNPKKAEATAEAPSADTYIPPGHVLVPVQIENSEALSAVMGPFAVVDLYSDVGGHSSLIAEKVKLIRAPLNPRQFAVLVNETLSSQIMQVKVPFAVVLQNRNTFKASLEKNLLGATEKKTQVAKVLEPAKPLPATSEPKPVTKRNFQIEYYERTRL
ncbi:MAG: hypothetical protein K0R29_122 [Pseudobdellovibrio sp.]|jgi:hypothetical protein|nr:hypothetical protein [Pseudobdellovibrio sp.]